MKIRPIENSIRVPKIKTEDPRIRKDNTNTTPISDKIEITDTVKISAGKNYGIKGNYSPEVKRLMDENDERIARFKKMIQDSISKQADSFKKSGIKAKKIDYELQNSAKKAIAPGGEYSVDAVSGRIIDFAKALANGDKSKISTLKKACLAGFGAARGSLGGKLPSICEETYNEVVKRFDEWEKE